MKTGAGPGWGDHLRLSSWLSGPRCGGKELSVFEEPKDQRGRFVMGKGVQEGEVSSESRSGGLRNKFGLCSEARGKFNIEGSGG